MSNSKNAYGWYGHIIVSEDENEASAKDNVVAIPHETFEKLYEDYNMLQLDHRIQVEEIGIIDSCITWLACGIGFSNGFMHFGTPFEFAELLVEGHQPYEDQHYHSAMKEIYNIELPPSRIMVGCSSER